MAIHLAFHAELDQWNQPFENINQPVD